MPKARSHQKRNIAKTKPKTQKSSGLPTPIKIAIVVVVLIGAFQFFWMAKSSNQAPPPQFPLPYIKGWGSYGPKPGQFNEPRDITCDFEGNVYVADTKNCRIQKFNPDGKFLKVWGGQGTKDGQFQGPCGLTVNKSDNILVLDWVDNRVQTFNKDGIFVSKFQGGFYGPFSITVDLDGNIWVSNAGGPNIHKFSGHGDFTTMFGQNGRKKGQMVDPSGIAVDEQKNFYVVDQGNQRIEKFDAKGQFLKVWKPSKDVGANLRRNILSPQGNLYVLDEAGRLWVLNKDLKPLKMWIDPPQEKLGALSGIAFDKNGFLYLTNYRDNRILKFGPLSE